MTSNGAAARRHGVILDAAILDAAWRQIVEHGVPGFTYEAIAARAHTSKPVIYRRWPSREELLVATVRAQLVANPINPPDTGSLREDTIAYLKQANSKRSEVIRVGGAMSHFFDNPNLTLGSLRERAMAGTRPTMDRVLDRARNRGELTAQLPQRVVELPFDLLRHQIIMSGHLTNADIDSIVDDVFLPLVAAYEHAAAGRGVTPS